MALTRAEAEAKAAELFREARHGETGEATTTINGQTIVVEGDDPGLTVHDVTNQIMQADQGNS